MRLHHVVLLVVVAIDAVSAATNSKLSASSSIVAEKNVARFLRTSTVADWGNEERGVSIRVTPGVEAVTNKKGTLKNLLKYANRKKSSKSKLKLDKAGTKLLGNSGFKLWAAYVRLIHRRHPDAAMVTSLTSRYGDEVLSKMLEAGLKMPKTKEAATALQTKQLEGWKNMGLSADDAFKTLNLNVGAEKVFKNPNLNAWVKYMDDLNSGLPRKNQVSMIDTFRRNFGDDALSKMLVAAKKDPVTEKIATDMQASLLSKWVLARKDPEAVSKIAGSSLEGKMLHGTYLEKFKLAWPDRL
ncbi:RxLR effector protein PSR2 [Phytophthora ramorum]|uniref:RxLR effector protein PSR2 n=1 Tax=Phytophthora ramorum TaxID=164328 RepID=UPI0030AD1720|nr:RxLR effector protein PSR2 [Phytophthora ramorum]